MDTVLTIAGFDPSSGAGISADLMVFAAHGLFGTACITALTVQNTLGVVATEPVKALTVTQTLETLFSDLPPKGIKIGMLATAEVVSATANFLRQVPKSIPIVLDPVLKSSSGKDLLDPEGIERLRKELLPLVHWTTPNITELAILTHRSSLKLSEVREAATALQARGRELSLVVTGGDQDPPEDCLFLSDSQQHIFSGTHVHGSATHGTGCAFSSALLCRLVLGDDPLSAVSAAKTYVASAIRTADRIGHGRGPLQHLWPLKARGLSLADRKSDGAF